jgi:hypothetical protein
LLDIAHLVNDETLMASQLFDGPAEFQITFCGKQLLDQQGTCGEVDAPAFLDYQLLRNGAEKVSFPASGIPENEQIFAPVQKTAVQQGPELPANPGRQAFQIKVSQCLVFRKLRFPEQPKRAVFLSLIAFPADQLGEVLLITQRFLFGTARGFFIAMPHCR